MWNYIKFVAVDMAYFNGSKVALQSGITEQANTAELG